MPNLTKSRRLIISGISGSGKTTLRKALEKRGFQKIPNVVTRLRRSGERARENIFIDDKTFRCWRKEGRLAMCHKTNGVWHDILQKHLNSIRNSRHLIYFDKSVPSANELIKLLPDVKFSLIYLLPPSFRLLYDHLKLREKDIGMAKKEIYQRFFEEIHWLKQGAHLPYVYVVNDKIERIVHFINS